MAESGSGLPGSVWSESCRKVQLPSPHASNGEGRWARRREEPDRGVTERDHDMSDDRMGRYEDIPPEQLRADLVRFARLLLRLDDEGRLLRAVPHVQSLLGDLRQKLFAFEVRGTNQLPRTDAPDANDPSLEVHPSDEDLRLRESLRIVREALARQDEATREWLNSEDETANDAD
jgi:hypothetical protein